MMNSLKKYNAGFTLIETLIYIVLFSVIIGGGMVGAYQIISSSDHTQYKTVLEQDSNFILRKINSSFDNAYQVTVLSPTNLLVDKDVDIYFRLKNGNVQINTGGAGYQTLNSSRITISSLSFEEVSAGDMEGIKTTFTCASIDGKVSQVFTSTKYVRPRY